LDNKSELEVQKALDRITDDNVTTIIIAHRLSTIKNADKILAIKDGSVVEQGDHNSLLNQNGYYENLIKAQLIDDDNLVKNNSEDVDENYNLLQNSRELRYH
jgi:ABC-type multidrug transport system fused ATPase/permease subunit